MSEGNTYTEAMESMSPEVRMTTREAVAGVLAARGVQPRITEHLFRPGTAGHEEECGVGVPDVEFGRIVGTTCGYPQAAHVQRDG